MNQNMTKRSRPRDKGRGNLTMRPKQASTRGGETIALVVLFLLLTAGATVSGQAAEATTPSRVTLLGAEPNLIDKTLIISGANLAEAEFRGSATLYAPHVGSVNLNLVAFDPERQELLADLPEGIAEHPGSYRLTVAVGRDVNDWATFVLTIDADPARTKNQASGLSAAVKGGSDNQASGELSTVQGGLRNQANGGRATVGGGEDQVAEGLGDTIRGGRRNRTSGGVSAVGGGEDNVASGNLATISGGWKNTAEGPASSVAGGERNVARGHFAHVVGGFSNEATGQGAWAGGQRAVAAHEGSFVWADGSSETSVSSTAPHQTLLRAQAGVGVNTTQTRAALNVGGKRAENQWLGLARNTDGLAQWHVNGAGGGLNVGESGVSDFRFYLHPGGNVGIGTGSPTSALSLGPNLGDTKLGLWDNGFSRIGMGIRNNEFALHLAEGAPAHFSFYDDDRLTKELVRIEGDGRVGIGTTQPNSNLDVAGTMKVGFVNAKGAVGVGTHQGTGSAGMMRWNGEQFEGFNGTEWKALESLVEKSKPKSVLGTIPDGMVRIPGGRFQMGDDSFLPDDERNETELPVHEVEVRSFFMGKTEVSNFEWMVVFFWAIKNDYNFSGVAYKSFVKDDPRWWEPVAKVSWLDLVKWCNARSERLGLDPVYYLDDAAGRRVFRSGIPQGLSHANVDWEANGFRLPTEAEWERAARGGLQRNFFPWPSVPVAFSPGGHFGPKPIASAASQINQVVSYQLANYANNVPAVERRYDGLAPVSFFAPNRYGLQGMAGNVREWCWDFYDPNWYSQPGASLPDTKGPAVPTSGIAERVCRGGSYSQPATAMRCAQRSGVDASSAEANVGFRVVRSR